MAFTSEQKNTILHKGHHAKVSAVAGSGKTSTMVSRAVYLMHNGVDSDDILVLMFNSKAQKEFESRITAQCKSYDQSIPVIKTFHAYGKWLTDAMVEEGFLPYARLSVKPWELDNMAAKALRDTVARKRSKIITNKENVEDFIDFIDLVKSDIMSPIEKFKDLKLKEDHLVYVDAFQVFEKNRRQAKIRFFSDLIYDPIMKMRKKKECREMFEDNFDYIIVDEYQDVNECQQELLRVVAGSRAKMMVVGDADQCIYEWRGAKPKYITHQFEEDFSDVETYNLSYTFRNGHAVSIAANYLIRHNLDRNPQTCRSYHTTPFTDIQTHAVKPFNNKVSSIVKEWTEKGKKLKDAVVLVRLYSMSAAIEMDLLMNNIPYRLQGRESVIDRKDIAGLINYVRYARGSLEAEKFDDTITRVTSMIYLTSPGLQRQIGKMVCEQIAVSPSSGTAYLEEMARSARSYTQQNLMERATIWKKCSEMGKEPAYKIMEMVMKTLNTDNYFKKLHMRNIQSEEKIRLFDAFVNIAKEVEESGQDFLEFIDNCHKEQQRTSKKSQAVQIMSIHKAKGMEWPLVIIPGLKEGDFPFYSEASPPAEVESERRLFYVGITRAEEELHILHPVDHHLTPIADSMDTNCEDISKGSASRFMYESNFQLANKVAKQIQSGQKSTIKAKNGAMAIEYLGLINEDIEIDSETQVGDKKLYTRPKGFESGDRILHPIFGEGNILGLEHDHGDTILIKFDQEQDPMNFILANIDLRKVETLAAH